MVRFAIAMLWLLTVITIPADAQAQQRPDSGFQPSQAFLADSPDVPWPLVTLAEKELRRNQRRTEALISRRKVLVARPDVVGALYLIDISRKTQQALRDIEALNRKIDALQDERRILEASLGEVGVVLASSLPPTTLAIDKNERAQEALIYLSFYEGEIDGEISGPTREAVERFQKLYGYYPSGVLDDRQRARITNEVTDLKRSYGMRILANDEIGYSLLYPALLLPIADVKNELYQRFSSSDGTSNLQVVNRESADLAKTFAELLGSYDVRYSKLTDEWFVVAGQVRDRSFYDVARKIDGKMIHLRLAYPVIERRRWSPLTVILYNSFIIKPAAIDEAAADDEPPIALEKWPEIEDKTKSYGARTVM